MKRILPIVGLLAASGSVFGQLPVSQTTENKNVVLEEFTGIHCTYCPDGHKRAQALHDANPDDVILVNIHAGGYATPGTGELDFRTSFGTAIANQSGLQGYPAGQINRRNFPGSEQTDASGTPVSGILAQGRGTWVSTAPTVLGETSFINLALDATIDLGTREMIVDVEMFETGAAPSTYNLNVALLQSNIEGTQTGSAYNPDQVLPNGNYVHNHALRHFLTGQWGDVITSTSGVITRQYIYTIPADIAGIPLEIGDLEVVAYIADGQIDIETGAFAEMDYVVPSGSTLADLSTENFMTVTPSLCDNMITPTVDVTNNESTSVSDYEVSYTLNGGTPVVQSVTTALAGGASASVTFPQITLPVGANELIFNVNLTSGSSYVEMSTSNNETAPLVFDVISGTNIGSTYEEGFESTAVTSTAATNTTYMGTPGLGAVYQTGNGTSNRSYRWNFYNVENGTSSFVINQLDLSQGSAYYLSFAHAYAQYSASYSDELQVRASSDCGATWTTLFSKSGANLSTVGYKTSAYVPATSEWVDNIIDLSAFVGSSDVVIEFVGISGYSNQLYVDDINLLNEVTVGLSEENVSSVNVFPNPSNGEVNVNIDMASSSDAVISILNSLGEVVRVENARDLSSGTNTITLDLNEMTSGIYYLNVVVGESTEIRKISIIK